MCTRQEQLDENERVQGSAQVLCRDQTPDSQGRSPHELEHQPSVQPVPDQSHTVLPVGTHRRPSGDDCLAGTSVRTEEALLTEVQPLRKVIAELSSENLQLKQGRWR